MKRQKSTAHDEAMGDEVRACNISLENDCESLLFVAFDGERVKQVVSRFSPCSYNCGPT
jgi:hypothetical protein